MVHPRASHIKYSIRELAARAQELEAKGHEILKLNIGDPIKYDYDTSQEIKDALIDAVNDGHNYYAASEGIPSIQEAVVKREKRLKNVDADPSNVLPVTGLSEGIHMLLAATVGNRDELLMPGPAYPPYIGITRFYDGTPVEYRTIEEENWSPDVDDIRKKINENTKALVVINPNNPTGAVYSKKMLKEIADIAIEHDLYVFSDEVYDMLSFGKEFTSMGILSEELRVVLMGGLSKVYLAPGWRMGYLIFNGPSEPMNELKNTCYPMARVRLSAPTPMQIAMKTAMSLPKDSFQSLNKKLKGRCDFSYKRLNEIDGISAAKPDGAMYIFPKIEDPVLKEDDRKFVLDLLHEKHVLCVHGSSFGEHYGNGHFRTVFLPDIEIQEEAFNRLEEFMKEHRSV